MNVFELFFSWEAKESSISSEKIVKQFSGLYVSMDERKEILLDIEKGMLNLKGKSGINVKKSNDGDSEVLVENFLSDIVLALHFLGYKNINVIIYGDKYKDDCEYPIVISVLVNNGVVKKYIQSTDVRESKSEIDANLFRAVINGDYMKCHELLLEGANPEAIVQHLPVIIHAIENNNEQIIKLFLKFGANPDIAGAVCDCDYYVMSALMWACYNDNIEIVKLLVDYGANINWENKKGENVFKIAVSNSSVELLEWLIQKGIKKCWRKDGTGWGMLSMLINSEYESMKFKYLINIIDDVDVSENNKVGKTKNVKTPLMEAVLNSNLDAVNILIENKANVNFVNKKFKCTALDMAIEYSVNDKNDIIKALKSAGAKTFEELKTEDKA
ncbi:ankyrin repeat domain-containing protein [Zooshikella harenae]|uniref:Ankyrin repeat domain-containing protein n=1 Tax=Zooshikella harenae TaxID=2827238 RepID=A0ABS5ZJ00_9GAMM|nr:ankyrin repeat domain-containing protein [Zooshikella harenae]MBU2713954.1 ankyrin repeat domain-containing protein [Zooshikella harenae]